jgi:hypothetical protein
MWKIIFALLIIIPILTTSQNYDRLLNKNYKTDIQIHFEPEQEFYKNQTVSFK